MVPVEGSFSPKISPARRDATCIWTGCGFSELLRSPAPLFSREDLTFEELRYFQFRFCSEIHQIEISNFAISFEMRAVFDSRPEKKDQVKSHIRLTSEGWWAPENRNVSRLKVFRGTNQTLYLPLGPLGLGATAPILNTFGVFPGKNRLYTLVNINGVVKTNHVSWNPKIESPTLTERPNRPISVLRFTLPAIRKRSSTT